MRNLFGILFFLMFYTPVFCQVRQISKDVSSSSKTGNKTYYWQQIYFIDSANIKPENELNIEEYRRLKSEIKTIEIGLENQYKTEGDARPKDPFETTSEYDQRIKNVKNRYKELLANRTTDLRGQMEYMESFQFKFSSNIKVVFDPEKYNADKGKWDIKLFDKSDTSNISIAISPVEARKLWTNISTLKVYELKKITNKQLLTLYITYESQSDILVLMRFNQEAQSSQTQNSGFRPDVGTEDKVFTKVEVEADYPGGVSAWRKFLSNNLKVDGPGMNGAPPGQYTVVVRFIVAKDGTVNNVEAETNYGYGMEQEAVRVLKLSGKWTPAMQNGRNVIAYKRQPITWVISE